MPTRNAEATWTGGLKDGKGNVALGSKAFSGTYSFATRFGETPGANPEELLGAAHAACYSMALSAGLEGAGHKATSIHTTAKVTIDKVGEGFKITRIALTTEGVVPGIDQATFKDFAEKTKEGCPVSQALKATPMTLDATLKA